MDWKTFGTGGCEECAAKREALVEVMKRWAANPLGHPAPGTTEFMIDVEKQTQARLQGGGDAPSGSNPRGGQG